MSVEKPLVRIRRKKDLKEKQNNEKSHPKDSLQDKQRNLEDLKEKIVTAFGQTADLKIDDIKIAETDGMLFFLESMIGTELLKETFMSKKMYQTKEAFDLATKEGLTDFCQQEFGGSGFQLVQTVDEVVTAMLNGSIAIAMSSYSFIVVIEMGNTEYRQVSEPTSQTVIRGPKDSFVESLSTNQSLIRRRIRNQNLRFEEFVIGNDTKTKVNLVYVNGIANEENIKEVRTRLNNINVSAIFESANIEDLISDKTFTLFPLMLDTERPDTVAGNIMEGKIGIIVDGSPFVLLVPAVFTDFFVSSEDYYHNFFVSSFIRIVRYIAFMIVLITPSAYVSLLTYNQEMVPTSLLINIVAQREGVPFPAVVEVFIMEFTFEILREAGIRMPRAVGMTVSIVGALVIGQAAVEAGLISNIMVIIVGITATANFVTPVYSLSGATRMLRFMLIIAAAFFGLYGVLLGLVIMVTHLASLRSFGVSYLSPVAPFNLTAQKDVLVLFPFGSLNKRPSYLRSPQPNKQKGKGSPSTPDMLGGNKR